MNKKVVSIVSIIIILLIGGFAFTKLNSKPQESEKIEESITVEHSSGKTEVKKNPETVVVLNYGALDVLDTLGVEVAALPAQGLPTYLEKYKDEKYVDLGGLKEFDLESINELNPDLIIIEGRQADYYEDLSSIAPTINLAGDSLDYIGSLEESATILGQIFDKEDEVYEKLESVKSELAEVKEEVESLNVDASLLFVADSSLSVFGEQSRFNMLYNEFGFTINDANVGDSKHGESISYEYVLEKNPDYIFIVDKNAVTGTDNNTAKEILENELVKKTKAYKNDKIIYLDSQAWYVGGTGFKAVETRINDIKEAIK